MNRLNHKWMTLNKRYKICTVSDFIPRGEDFTLYTIKRNNIIHIYKHDESSHDFSNDTFWIKEGFADLKLLWRCALEYRDEGEPACYVIVRELNGSGRVVELLSKRDVIKEFQIKHYRGCAYNYDYKYSNESYWDYKEIITDAILCFWNQERKNFSLFSIKDRKFFFTYDYKYISVYNRGVILDDKLAVEYDGFIHDFTGYEFDGQMFYNREKDEYWMIIDENEQNGCFIASFEHDDNNENILTLNSEEFTYTYNKKTEELKRKQNCQEEVTDWSDYTDIAYEGYSRLYLGLED